MKSKRFILVMAVVLVAGLSACGQSNIEAVSDTNTTASTEATVSQANEETDASKATKEAAPATVDQITEEQAKQAALSHAGLTEADVTFINVHLDTEDGTAMNNRLVFEVEFYSGNTEYDYEIDASSGEIISFDHDVENYTIPGNSSVAQSTDEYIGEDKAKAIALAKVPGATESDLRIHLDYDDGIVAYEGTIIYDKLEYEFEINAADGTIIEWSVESVYDD